MRGERVDGGCGARKPWSKWSADTERAFLLALKLTGQVAKAAAEIGRSRSSCHSRRRTHPAFAEAWDAALAEQQAEWAAAGRKRLGPDLDSDEDGEGGGRLTPWRDKAGGWDARKRGLFLRNLARTKTVNDACAAAGMSPSAAYYLRGQSPRFAAAWTKALAADAPPSVAEAAFERAVHGWVEPIVAGGRIVGERRRYSDSLLGMLLRRDLAIAEAEAAASKDPAKLIERAHAAARAAGGGFYSKASEEETNAALAKKLDAIERRRAAEAEERAQEARRIGDSAGAARALPGPRVR